MSIRTVVISTCLRETRSSDTDKGHLVFWAHSQEQLWFSQWISKEMSQAQVAPELGFGERLAFIKEEVGGERRPLHRLHVTVFQPWGNNVFNFSPFFISVILLCNKFAR